MSLVCFTSDTVNVFHIIDEMKFMGWYIQPQLGLGCSKENIHLSINLSNVQWADALIEDLKVCVEKAKKIPQGDLAQTISATFASADPDSFEEGAFSQMLAMAGIDGVNLPERMAEIHEVLNALPPNFREMLLIEFFNDMFHLQGNSKK